MNPDKVISIAMCLIATVVIVVASLVFLDHYTANRIEAETIKAAFEAGYVQEVQASPTGGYIPVWVKSLE